MYMYLSRKRCRGSATPAGTPSSQNMSQLLSNINGSICLEDKAIIMYIQSDGR